MAVNYLEILRRGVPPGKQNRARTELVLVQGVATHLLEMGILGLALAVGRIPPRVHRVAGFGLAATLHQTPHPNPFDDPVFVATVRGTDQGKEPGVAFVRHAVIHKQTRLFTICYPVFEQLLHLSRHEPLLVQKISDHVVAHVF
jgi:hypothetical protein